MKPIVPALGKFPRRALLTGAGFGKNWDGYLANAIWSQLASSLAVRGSPPLASIFNREIGYFENALAEVRLAAMKDEALRPAVDALEKEIIEVFIEQEQIIRGNYRTGAINAQGVEEMLSLFGRGPVSAGNRFQAFDSGYIFTVNQDLLVECITPNGHMYHQPTTPGVAPFTDQQKLTRDSFRPDGANLRETRRVRTGEDMTLAGNLNYIKMHGSHEWRTDDGRDVLVVGGSKEDSIREFPLLATYLEVFSAVCSTPGLRLMVLGYGFGDAHINRIIANGVRSNELTLAVFDTRPPQDTRKLLESGNDDCKAIASQVLWWYERPLVEVFPRSGAARRGPLYRRILSEFFEWDVPA